MGETATVVDVVDGDTIDVRLDDGSEERVRIIGIDTPETTDNADAERRAEWEGIEDLSYLGRWGDRASEFAKRELTDATVELEADANEPDRGSFGRLLRYVRYDRSGEEDEGGEGSDSASGDASTVYNRAAVAEGYARVYDSGFARHDDYLDRERSAREGRTRVWKRSDPSQSPEVRDREVERLFVPEAASVRTASGAVPDDRVPVFASPSATREGGEVSYGDRIPLVAVDGEARVAMVGGPLLDERYEEAEGFEADTSRFGNYPFATNVLVFLSKGSERPERVVVDGGHGQFNAEYALSCEDMAYYLRFLEGQDAALVQQNDLADGIDGDALIVCAPAAAYGDSELSAFRSFVEGGGVVLLLGHGAEGMPADARENLNALAEALGSDLRLGDDRVVDAESNLNDDETLPRTSNFEDSFDLFGPVTPDGSTGPSLSVVGVDPSGAEGGAGESISLANEGDAPVDLSGWAVADEAGHEYEFPEGTVVPAGATVHLLTGEGDDEVTVHWGRERSVWNDDGDTVSVYDEAGDLVAERSY
ncbi:lamin tail domain-containing protein [Halogeometricum sp. S1BR25-6]|uniref:Lamin tail domain-containing protein n=1 Tax=Halogeometricum salsisoli TaxID=2950536 RepID=A0ABU2GJ55_9EURY|nr:lamin tail domain-containing protein [Halogeometricum sp. S1BR25-6]MDS0300862.1 lamin tail domain-containing protein [Halogeometricum sp. S1BR25-6]